MSAKPDETPALPDDQQKRLALDLILDVWDAALNRGVTAEILATTAIYAALTDMVELYGEEPVAKMMAEVPARVRAGEFSLNTAATSH